MMPETTPARVRRCPSCDDFPAVAITTGQLLTDGTRQTVTAVCRTCEGTGSVVRRRVVREVTA